MNIRQKYQLKVLVNEGQIDIVRISEEFNLNQRTVRYDLETINKFLNELNLNEILIKNNLATLDVSNDNKKFILDEISKVNLYLTKLSADERMVMVIFDLCWEDKELKIEDLCEKYFVSRSTINNDIVSIKKWCKKNEIEFISNKGKGIKIHLKGAKKQDALSKVIRLYEKIKRNYDVEYLDNEIIEQWFPDIDVNLIGEIIKKSEDKYAYWLTDIAFEALVIHIAMSIKRFTMNQVIESHISDFVLKKDSIQYVMSTYIISEINKEFSIYLDDQEVYYVAIHIGSKVSSKVESNDLEYSYLEFNTLDLIYRVSSKLDIDMREDEKLYEGLLQHLNASSIRMKQKMMITNPIKDEIISDYKELYDIVDDSLDELENQQVIIKTDDEIAYIVLHFASSLSRVEAKKAKLARILLVCSTGVGTAELLLTYINKHFVYEDIQIASEHQLRTLTDLKGFDLILSTIPLNSSIPTITVSTILKDKDIIEIRNKMMTLNLFTGSPSLGINQQMNHVAKYLINLANKYSSENQENELIKNVIELAEKLKINDGAVLKGGKLVLSNLLYRSHIKLREKCDDWIEAVEKSGRLLIEDGCITNDYIKAVIENVKEVGPYIVITKGVALPHATNEKGVNKTSLSLITLEHPINFGNKNNDPVEFVFMLAPQDSKSHLRALSDLAEMLGNKEFLDLLRNTTSIDEILEYINQNETK